MTMLLGINLEDRAYLSADTRATYLSGKKEDNVQKIEFLPKHNLMIAAAGKVVIAKAILEAIDNGLTTVKSLPSEFQKILDRFLEKTISQKLFPIDPLKNGDMAMIFHETIRSKIYMTAIEVKFTIDQDISYQINERVVGNGQYIIVGGIIGNKKIEIANIPEDSKKYISNPNITYDDYALATDKIFETIQNNGNLRVGGKTISIKTFIDSTGNCKYIGIPGIKSIIHNPDEYQDVSTVTRFEESSNRFYLRDIRQEGMIISNIEYNGPYPIRLKYDSCPKGSGKPDMYYIPFSKYENKNMDLELALNLCR